MVSEDGYLVLGDFGIASRIRERQELCRSFCGTREYMCNKYKFILISYSTRNDQKGGA